MNGGVKLVCETVRGVETAFLQEFLTQDLAVVTLSKDGMGAADHRSADFASCRCLIWESTDDNQRGEELLEYLLDT